MQAFDRIREYSKTVCNQIRWEKAHEPILKEIENHIMDQRDAYIEDGTSDMEATENAIRQMGDPVSIGTQLDRTHRPKAQWEMLILTIIMVVMGGCIRLFIFPNTARPSISVVEMGSIIVGIIFMLIAYFLDFTLIGKYPKALFAAIVGMTIIVIEFSPVINGSAYYAVSLSLLFPLALVAIVYALRNRGYLGIVLCGGSFMILSAVIMEIPSAAALLNLGLFTGVMFVFSIYKNGFNLRHRIGYLISALLASIPIIFWIVKRTEVVRMRLQWVFQNLEEFNGESYIGSGIKQMITSSKFIGHSQLSKGIAPPDFQVSNGSIDMLLTYLIYNFGWITFIGIMSIVLFFIVKGFRLALSQKSQLGLWVSLAIMMTYSFQVVGYVLWNLGLILIAPMTLPFISYGNMALIVNLTLVGVMLSVFRTGDMVRDESCKSVPSERFIVLKEGKLIINLDNKWHL